MLQFIFEIRIKANDILDEVLGINIRIGAEGEVYSEEIWKK
ncbi:hypothetical protein [Saccharicrinis aurantiacus]|nr:hypothetical protein [Saccharicrinis aurantiacus]